ncbi:MAG: type III-B CRISPR-associated protein Cas10/Cmr2, partial [Pyrobaculum sp.]
MIERLKIAALLHEPPEATWLIVEGKYHEDVAVEVLKRLADLPCVPSEVRKADMLASSIDRYILYIFGYRCDFLPETSIRLKNIVNPFFVSSLPPIVENKVGNFRQKLYSLENVEDLRLRYLLLYGLYEWLWIDAGLPVGPADTRVPTHTVFDHNYATATALNWIPEGGLLVGIDVAGVQDFIKASRKLRDMWASSYLVSALVWYTILPLVEKIGPDVVITPSLRYNPIFHHWLKDRWHKEVKKMEEQLERTKDPERIEKIEKIKKAIEGLLKRVEKYVYLSDELREMYERLNLPPYAAFPERATLALPPRGRVDK